jgi:hypothetical protein
MITSTVAQWQLSPVLQISRELLLLLLLLAMWLPQAALPRSKAVQQLHIVNACSVCIVTTKRLRLCANVA